MRRAALLFLVIAACGRSSTAAAPTPATPAASPPPSPPAPPRRCSALGIDWCNHAYGRELVGYRPIALVGGDWEEHLYACDGTAWAGEHVTFLYTLRDVLTGDLDGDGTDDAVVAIDDHYDGCGDQGSYDATHLIAYAVRDGVATPIASYVIDRRVDWRISIADRAVVRASPRGCTERWRLAGTELAPAGARCP